MLLIDLRSNALFDEVAVESANDVTADFDDEVVAVAVVDVIADFNYEVVTEAVVDVTCSNGGYLDVVAANFVVPNYRKKFRLGMMFLLWKRFWSGE
uniref:Uncharacterized protein n=1 Tax=Fagus sylvatica TaxID=28930 RepID=A0A2N9H8A4_FAGSY